MIFNAIPSPSFSVLRNSAYRFYLSLDSPVSTQSRPIDNPVFKQSSDPTALGSLEGRLVKAKSSDVALLLSLSFRLMNMFSITQIK